MSLSDTRVAAIVPAHNEELTIGSVVATLKASPYINEVVVVSDGSNDRTVLMAEAAGAMVVERKENVGKGQALREGVAKSQATILLFCDADLKGFTADHVVQLLEPVMNQQRMMNVGLRDRGKWLNLFLPHLPLIGGERALRREVIEGIAPQYLSGYMVESALNYYCRSRQLPYGSVLLPGLSIRRKYEKVGWAKALWQYGKMIFQIIKAMLLVRIAHLRGTF